MDLFTTQLTIRVATPADAQAIQEIYAHYVHHSTATFDLIPPSVQDIKQRIHAILDKHYPYFVAVHEETIVGFTYAKLYYGRAGFASTLENSIYIDHQSKGLKIGSQLMQTLITACQEIGVKSIIAYIGGGDKNQASVHLHHKFGFQLVGTYKDVGYKFNDYHDMSSHQLIL